MRKIYVLMLVITMILAPVISGVELNDENKEQIRYQNKNKLEKTNDDNITIEIYPSTLSLGLNIDITNSGGETLTDLEWRFRSKPVVKGNGFFIKEKTIQNTIKQIKSEETVTIKFRPFNSENKSPIGLGNVYMDLIVDDGENTYRGQKRAMLFLFFLIDFKDTYMDIPPEKAYSLYQNDTFDLIIDVVGLDIYSLGHLPGAVNYVWANGNLSDMIPTLNETGTYLVYCHTDPPSTDSAQSLVDAGIKNTYRLEGNFKAWEDAGYPVED